MAPSKALLSNLAIGKLTLMAILVAVAAFIAAILSGHNAGIAFTEAALVSALAVGILAGLRQWETTGSLPGPLVSGGALVALLGNVLVSMLPQLLSTPETSWGIAAFSLIYIVKVEEALMATPNAPVTPAKSAPVTSANTVSFTDSNSTSSVPTDTTTSLDHLIHEIETPPKSA